MYCLLRDAVSLWICVWVSRSIFVSAFAYMFVCSSVSWCLCLCLFVCTQHHLPLGCGCGVKIPDSHSSQFQKQLISHPTSWLAATSKTKMSLESRVLHMRTHHLQSLIQHHPNGWSRVTVAIAEHDWGVALNAKTAFDKKREERWRSSVGMEMTTISWHKI